MSDVLSRYARLAAEAEELTRRRDRLAGVLQQQLSQLGVELSVTTVSEAEKLGKKLADEEHRLERALAAECDAAETLVRERS